MRGQLGEDGSGSTPRAGPAVPSMPTNGRAVCTNEPRWRAQSQSIRVGISVVICGLPPRTLINRIDWLSSFANEVPFVHAAEQLMGIEAPPRAVWIRTVLTELSRIATFLLFLGEMGLQVGAHARRSTASATVSTSSTSSRPSPVGVSTPTSTALAG